MTLQVCSLAGDLLARMAESRLDKLPDFAAETAARKAEALVPWNADVIALHGWILLGNGEAPVALEAYSRAIGWAPSDPLLWDEYALALGRAGVFDSRLAFATRRALSLAPNSPAVRASIAAMGDAYPDQGSDEVRAMWAESRQWMREHGGATRR